jgi:hypothetical protein
MKDNFKRLMFLFLCLFLLSVFNPNVIAVTETEADLIVNEAEENLALTFEVVKEAEVNGADISGLSEILNDATQLFAQAQNSFRVGDFEKANNFANLVLEIGNEVKSTALTLEKVKSDLPVKELWNTIIGSFFAVVFVVIFVVLGWKFFKRYYYRRKSLMRPEVVSFEH